MTAPKLASFRLVFVVFAIVASANPSQASTLFGLIDTGELFSSPDQGVTWTVHSTLLVRDAVGLAAGDTSSELYLASRSGVVYRSIDAGVNWTAVGAVSASDVVEMVIRSDLSIVLLTETGSVYVSVNQGTSFSAVAALTGSNFVSLDVTGLSERLYALTRTGEVSESADGGVDWTVTGAIAVSNAVEFRVGAFLWVLTATGDVFQSADDGASWDAVGTLSQTGMTALATDGATLLSSTSAGEVAISTDGANWTWQGVINQLTVTALSTDEPATSSVDPDPTTVVGVSLGTPWPNPARGATAAIFPVLLVQPEAVKLELYDSVGRQIAERDWEYLDAGFHELRWQPPVSEAGVYLARLTTGPGTTAARKWTVFR